MTTITPLYDAVIEQVERLIEHCNGRKSVPLSQTLAAFEEVAERLEELGLRLSNGEAMIRLVRLSRRDFARGERMSVRYDLATRLLKALKAARDDAATREPVLPASKPHDTHVTALPT